MTLAYLDGQFMPEPDAHIAISDPALLYGLGLFESVRTYGGVPFRLPAHIERLLSGAAQLEIRPHETPAEIETMVAQLTARAALPDAYVRITVTPEHTFATAKPMTLYPANLYEQGAKIVVFPYARYSRSALAGLKTLNYLDHHLARRFANKEGAVDAIVLNENGRVAEASASNVFILYSGRILTPPLSEGQLPGITRDVVLELLRKDGLPHAETPITTDMLRAADEIMLTGSLKEVMPIAWLGDQRVGKDASFPTARRLMRLYRNQVALECRHDAISPEGPRMA
jgi:branched-chain amino acid aminotransferase